MPPKRPEPELPVQAWHVGGCVAVVLVQRQGLIREDVGSPLDAVLRGLDEDLWPALGHVCEGPVGARDSKDARRVRRVIPWCATVRFFAVFRYLSRIYCFHVRERVTSCKMRL